MSDDCIFCKIAAGTIPTTFLWEDDEVVAFRDINPQAPFHILVIPREHLGSTLELNPTRANLVGHLIGVGILCARQAGYGDLETGFRHVINTGEDGGQSVGHLHVHLLAGRKLAWPPG